MKTNLTPDISAIDFKIYRAIADRNMNKLAAQKLLELKKIHLGFSLSDGQMLAIVFLASRRRTEMRIEAMKAVQASFVNGIKASLSGLDKIELGQVVNAMNKNTDQIEARVQAMVTHTQNLWPTFLGVSIMSGGALSLMLDLNEWAVTIGSTTLFMISVSYLGGLSFYHSLFRFRHRPGAQDRA